MDDVLIRGLPDDVLASVDERARRLGLSRDEYLLRWLTQEARRSDGTVTAADLRRFAGSIRDLDTH